MFELLRYTSVGKLYEREVIERVMAYTKHVTGEEQFGFRGGLDKEI